MKIRNISRSRANALAAILVAFALMVVSGQRLASAQAASNSTGSASSWHAGATAGTAPSTHATLGGSSSSWTAGKGSNPVSYQAGGIWRDGSVMGTATTRPVAGKPALGTSSAAKSIGPAGQTRTGVSSAKPGSAGMHAPGFPSGIHTSIVAHGASGAGSIGGTHTAIRGTSLKAGGIGAHGNRSASKARSGSTSLKSSLASPVQDNPAPDSLSPSSGAGSLNPSLPSPLVGASH